METISKTHDWVTIPNKILDLVKVGKVINSSWSHDGLPSFQFGPIENFEYGDLEKYCLWVNTEDPKHPWRDTEERFQIVSNDPEDMSVFLSTDSLEEVLKFIEDNNV